jgi:tRNA pseudouridine13 synthase
MATISQDLPSATLRAAPEDFIVDELAAYEPSGRGEHLFVRFRKTGLTTMDAVRQLAAALGTDARAAGYAGMKDRHAVTTQTASFAWPLAREVEPAMAEVRVPGIEVLSFARHDGKLKPGHLTGNRFRIVLRELAPEARDGARARLVQLGEEGVPNTFGPQRFGRDGDNPARTLAWLSGRERGPRDKREQRFLFSSLQAWLFNRVLDLREEAGTWRTILAGDVAKKVDSGGLFTVPAAGPELDDAIERGRAGQIGPTGPIYGSKMRWPEGEVLRLEQEVLATCFKDPKQLDQLRHLGEGTRRPLRLPVSELDVTKAGADALTVTFVLPKGGYATTVLGRACRLVDRGGAGPSASGGEPRAEMAEADEETEE